MEEYDNGALAFRLRQELRGNDSFDEPEVENRWASFGNWQLVGNGGVTNEYCGRFFGVKACSRVELHNRIKYVKVNIDGKEIVKRVTGKVDRKIVLHYCNKPSCPVCYKYGWASRASREIESRLAEASKRFGLVEHIVATVPPKFYGLSYGVLRHRVIKILRDRGVIGGVLIFHGFRYNRIRHWYWSPHFHVLCFIFGGYKCRNCKIVKEKGKCGIENRGCEGFVNRNYRCYERDGCIVKVASQVENGRRVAGVRKTVGGTAWYQLHHSSIDVTKKRFHVYTYFGVVSYRKLKVTVEKHKDLCRICGHELVWHDYFGSKRLVTDRNDSDFKRVSFEDLEENGVRVYVERAPKYG